MHVRSARRAAGAGRRRDPLRALQARHRRAALALIAAATLLGARRARAEADVVITGTRTPEATHKATVRTDVVTRAEAERRGATTVADALAGNVGVQVNPSASGSIGGASAIQILGFDKNRVLVLEDGERAIGDVGGAIDLAALPLTDVARVEVVPGPSSALYGASALGGVVNVLSATPVTLGTSGRARVEGRSPRAFLGQASVAQRWSKAWVVADTSWLRRDGIALRTDRPDLALPATSRRLIGARAGIQLGDRVELRLRARWIVDDLRGLESQDAPGLGRYLIDLPDRHERVALHAFELLDLGHGAVLRLSLARQWFGSRGGKDRRDSPIDEHRTRTHTLDAAEATLTIGDGPRTWVVGSRTEVERFEQSLRKTIAIDASGALGAESTVEVPRTTLANTALYAQGSTKLGEQLTILGGVRGELHRHYGHVVAPRLAIAARPTKALTIRAGVGHGFRSPSPKELGFAFDHSYYGYRVDGDRDLRPERSWGVNGDVAWTRSSKLVLRAGAFANWVRDLIDIAPEAEVGSGGVNVYSYRNVGRARTAGAQLDAAWPVSSWLRAELGYAHLWTRDDVLDRPLASRPPHTFLGALRLSLPHELEGVARYRLVSDAFVDDALRSPSFQTLDVRVAKTLWPAAQAYVGVLNAFDERKDPTRPADTRPIEGRIFYLGLRAELPAEE